MQEHMINGVYRRNLILNFFAGFVLLYVWFDFYELKKIFSNPFGFEFTFFCLFIFGYVSLQLVTSLLNNHQLKEHSKSYVRNLKVAAIIPCYNEDQDSIKDALFSLLNQSHPLAQIHVTDDGSVVDYSQTAKWFLEQCSKKGVVGSWVKQENLGKREAHASAIERIDQENCDIIVTVDSDTLLDQNAIKKGLIPFQNPKTMSVAGLVVSKNAQVNILSRIVDMIFVAHQQLIDRLAIGFFGQVIVNNGPLAFYRKEVVDLAIKSGYTEEYFRGRKVKFSDDSYLTLAALLLGKTQYQPESIAFFDMPTSFDHHRRQQLRWMRGSYIRGLWRIKYLDWKSVAWFRQLFAWLIFFSTSFMIPFLLINDFKFTMQTLLPLTVMCSFVYGLRYFCVKRSDMDFKSQFLTFILTPLAIFWSMIVLRVLRLYGTFTNSKQKWGTRESVEAIAKDSDEFETSFKRKKNLRFDIEGLRAFAIIAVVIYHFFGSILPGGFVGVDIFFVISGFIIISTVLREIKKNGRFSVRGFYGRRIRRILPAATVVLVITAILVHFYLPMSVWKVFGIDIIAAALYFVNFEFAFRSVDYMQAGTMVSPIQHFWSLSVEEQFYFITPILMILLLLFAKVFTRKFKITSTELYYEKRYNLFRIFYLVALVVVIIISLGFCIWFTETNKTMSYFVSPSRFWEMAFGSILAVLVSYSPFKKFGSISFGRITANVLSFIGLVGLVASLFIINDTTNWPGVWTLLPIVAAVIFILAGSISPNLVGTKIFGSKPLVFIGGISFSIYLWHWVLLVVFQNIYGKNGQLLWWQSILVIILSVICSLISKVIIEDPIRFSKYISSRKRITYSLGIGLMLCSLVAGGILVWQFNLVSAKMDNQAYVNIQNLGDLESNMTSDHFDSISPNPLKAFDDLPQSYEYLSGGPKCSQDNTNDKSSAEPLFCVRGDKNSKKIVVAVGDSMMQQWETALDDWGQKSGYQIHQFTKSGCLFADALTINRETNSVYTACRDWGKSVLKKIIDDKPIMMLTSQVETTALKNPDNSSEGESDDAWAIGVKSFWNQIAAAKIPISFILKNPTPRTRTDGEVLGDDDQVLDCVTQNLDNLKNCEYFPLMTMSNKQKDLVEEFAKENISAKMNIIDMKSSFCYTDSSNNSHPDLPHPDLHGADSKLICPSVVGENNHGTIVYRKGSHITNTYIRQIEPQFFQKLDSVFSTLATK